MCAVFLHKNKNQRQKNNLHVISIFSIALSPERLLRISLCLHHDKKSAWILNSLVSVEAPRSLVSLAWKTAKKTKQKKNTRCVGGWYLVVVVNLHHVPLAIADPSNNVGRHSRFGLAWKREEKISHFGRFTPKDQLNSLNQLLGCCKYLLFSFLLFFRRKFSSTCRECELYLFVDDFHGDEVMFLIEAAVVEQQAVGLPGSKSGERKNNKHFFTSFVWI